MPGPAHTAYYNVPLSTFGASRIACTRFEAAGRRIAQQFLTQAAVDQALVERPSKINEANMLHFAEYLPLRHAERADIKRLLQLAPKKFSVELAKSANSAHFSCQDWLKLVTRLQSQQKLVEAQMIIDALIGTGEHLSIGFLAVALKNAYLRGQLATWAFLAGSVPLPRIPVPYPSRQLQIVISRVRQHKNPLFPQHKQLNAQFFGPNWRQSPELSMHMSALLEQLARGYLKQSNERLLDCVMWWAHVQNRFSRSLAHTNLLAAQRFSDFQRAWWTWQQVKQMGLEADYGLMQLAMKFPELGVSGNGYKMLPIVIEAPQAKDNTDQMFQVAARVATAAE